MSLSLLEELTRQNETDEFILYSFDRIPSKIMNRFSTQTKNIVVRPRKAWNYLALPLALLKNRPDIFIGLSQSLPYKTFSKSVLIVHDLAFELIPHAYPGSYSRLHRITKTSAKRADKIVAVSNSTKKDLSRLYNIDKQKISVIYEGVDSMFHPQPAKEINRIRRRYDLNKKYFLFIGSLKKIKNVPVLLRAFAAFLEKRAGDYQLVLVGSNYWPDGEINAIIKAKKLQKKVKSLGFVSDHDLPGLYSGSSAFIMPSLYEGFGIPILESMACGTPVITSNTGSMPEIAGKAALLVNPLDTAEICKKMWLLEEDSSLRSRLIQKGLLRAKQYSWSKMARQLRQSIGNI